MHREKLSHKEAARLYYYYTKKQKEPDKHAELKEEICAIVAENKGRYGYRRVTQELRNRGLTTTIRIRCGSISHCPIGYYNFGATRGLKKDPGRPLTKLRFFDIISRLNTPFSAYANIAQLVEQLIRN